MSHIRPATPVDYEAIAEITTLTRPEMGVTADDLLHDDDVRDPKCQFGLWVAESEGQVVGFTRYEQYADLYDPHRLWVMVQVHPAHQRQGIGTALYEQLLAAIAPLQMAALQVSVREDRRDSVRFAEGRGFHEYSRRWEAHLDLKTADLSPFQAVLETVEAGGIQLKSVAALADDPDRDAKLHELQWQIEQDVPIDEPITQLSLEQWQRQYSEHPHFLADGTFVAVDGDAYVGLSLLFCPTPGQIHIDLTGTRRDYRRRGIALALKMRGIQYGQGNGHHTIVTTNDVSNTGILAINEQLGFVRQPARLQLMKQLI